MRFSLCSATILQVKALPAQFENTKAFWPNIVSIWSRRSLQPQYLFHKVTYLLARMDDSTRLWNLVLVHLFRKVAPGVNL